MRFAEAAGLLKSDIILDEGIPFIKLQPHALRKLKIWCEWGVPLVGMSLWAAQRLLNVVSSCSLGKDHLINCQIRHCPPQKRVLSLKQLQSLQLIVASTAVLFVPAIICLNSYTNPKNRIH